MPKLKRRADGRYQKVIVDKRTGKKVFFYGKSEKELNQKVLSYTGEQEKGAYFNDVADSWWEETEQTISYQSRQSYGVALKRAQEEFKSFSIKDIKPKDILFYINKLVNKGYAQKTISNHKMVVNRIFEYAVINNFTEFNPCASVKLPKNLQKSKRSAATTEEEKIIFESSEEWLFPFIALMTGARKGEILALQYKDIDFNANTIKITKSIYYEGNSPKIKLPKTEAGIRTVPLLEPLKQKLLQNKFKQDDFIISDKEGNPISKKSFRWKYAQFQKKTGVNCTAHQIRHSFATNAFECDISPKAVQELLGHKQLSTTMDIYTDFRKKAFDEAASKLNENFKK